MTSGEEGRLAGGEVWSERERLAALRRFGILDTAPETAFDDLVVIAAEVCAAPIAVVNFIDAERQWFKAELGLGVRETALDVSICRHAILQQSLFVVPDTTADERFACNPLVAGEPHLRFYAGALIETDDGLPLGTVCVLDYRPRPEGLTPQQGEMLSALARAAMRELYLRYRSRLLQTTLDAIDLGLVVVEPNGRLPVVNARAVEVLDLPEHLLRGTPHIDEITRRQAERGEFAYDDDLCRLVQSGGSCTAPYVYERTIANGTVIEVRTVPFDGGGGALRTISDITKRRKAEAALGLQASHYKTLADALPQMVWVADCNGETIYCNKRMVEYRRQIGQSLAERFSLFHPEDLPLALAARERGRLQATPEEIEVRCRRHDGVDRWHRVTLAPVYYKDEISAWIGIALDIHEARQAEALLHEQRDLLSATLEHMDQGILMVDAEGRVRVSNKRFSQLLGVPEDFMRTNPLFEEVAAFQEATSEFERANKSLDWWQARSSLYRAPPIYERERPNGAYLEIRTVHRPDGSAVRTYADITARKRAELDLQHVARHDALTTLPNRRAFQEKLEEFSRTATREQKLGLLLLDLDNFKDLNDTMGHDAGDWLLATVAARLGDGLPTCALPARLGGDEFAVLLPGTDVEELKDLAERLRERLRQPLHFQQRDISRRASIGIAMCPDHGERAADLSKAADIALYAAKRRGRDQAVVFTGELAYEAQRRVRVLHYARDAISDDGVIPFYQPKIDFETGSICGFEALLRWRHPRGGLRSPAELDAAFDDPELAVALGERMLDRITSDMREWRDRGLAFGSVALNVANAEFARPNFAKRVLAAIDMARLLPEHLQVEVTEKVLLGSGACQAASAMQHFHDAGVAVALDDFGTGFASLTHLNQFPLAWIKIDRSFVMDIETSPRAAAIVEGVINLARSLDIKIVAEGVETQQQADFLRRVRCHAGQGFLFGKAMPSERVPYFLRTWDEEGTSSISGGETPLKRAG